MDQGTFNAKVLVPETFDVEQADEVYRRTDEEPEKITNAVMCWADG
jgi:hypothetical protein